MRINYDIVKIFLPLLVLILILGCSDPVEYTEDYDNTNTSTTTGLLRFIHAASTTDNLVLNYRDLDSDTYETFISGPEYGFQYGYYSFRTGVREFAAFEANTSIKIAQTKFELEENKKYSLIAFDYDATLSPDLLVLEDTLSVPDSAYSFVRFLHLASGVGTIEIEDLDYVQVLTELDANAYSVYLNLQSRTYFLNVRLQSTQQNLLYKIPATFLSGVTYTVILSGSINSLTPVELNMNILRDESIDLLL
ncbi:MAG: DUF4397 domain-containing protein [Calditrichaceae bacterium]|nr:DUF4397 domain-containing protein [Calditrichaceae bacterium]